jgi:hypothetical protein
MPLPRAGTTREADGQRRRDRAADGGARDRPEVDVSAVDFGLPLQEVADMDSRDFLTLVAIIHERTGMEIPVPTTRSCHTELVHGLRDPKRMIQNR